MYVGKFNERWKHEAKEVKLWMKQANIDPPAALFAKEKNEKTWDRHELYHLFLQPILEYFLLSWYDDVIKYM